MRLILFLLSLLVPAVSRPRWREEWLAELQLGGWRMLAGALPDAWALRRLWRPSSGGSRGRPFHAIGQDLRYSLRGLAKSPGFVCGVVLSLSLGIGGNVVAFSFINMAVFRPFPGVHAQHELVRISVAPRDERGFPVIGRAAAATERVRLDTLRAALTTLSGVSAHYDTQFAVSIDGETFAGPGGLVSSNYFDVLGVRPAAGRFFAAADDDPAAAPVAVISHATWMRRFHGDPAAIGRQMSVNGTTVQVIGVAGEGFQGVRKGDDQPEVWIPFGLAELTLRDRAGRAVRAPHADAYFDFVGRRRSGVPLEQVQAETSVLAARFQARTTAAVTYVGSARRVWLNDPVESAPAIAAFMVIPLLVLAIGCVNAANLLVARATRQARDWSVRVALGASRWRVLRQVLSDAVMLSLLAAATGLFLARVAIALAEHQLPLPIPFDARVAAFTITLAFAAAIAFSLGPAFGVLRRAARRTTALTSAAPPRSRIRFALVALQAALSLGLLTTGAQFANTVFAANPNAAPIPDPDRLVLASLDLDLLRATVAESDEFYGRLIARARQIPGVIEAGTSTPGLVTGVIGRTAELRVSRPDAATEESTTFWALHASPGALKAIGVPLVSGRDFTELETADLRTVIVNEPFARRFLNGNALGQTIRVIGSTTPERAYDVTIVGIAGGIIKRADNEPAMLYHPIAIGHMPARVLYLRLDDSGRFSAGALHAAVRDVDARVPVLNTSTLGDHKARQHFEQKLLARGAAALGLLALMLAAGGFYGVVSYIVTLRRQEMGIRLALGAEPRSLVAMITRQALMPAVIGSAIGLFASGLVAVVVRSRFHGASPIDPLVFAGATTIMMVVLSVATVLPASRAARINPVDTLRTE